MILIYIQIEMGDFRHLQVFRTPRLLSKLTWCQYWQLFRSNSRVTLARVSANDYEKEISSKVYDFSEDEEIYSYKKFKRILRINDPRVKLVVTQCNSEAKATDESNDTSFSKKKFSDKMSWTTLASKNRRGRPSKDSSLNLAAAVESIERVVSDKTKTEQDSLTNTETTKLPPGTQPASLEHCPRSTAEPSTVKIRQKSLSGRDSQLDVSDDSAEELYREDNVGTVSKEVSLPTRIKKKRKRKEKEDSTDNPYKKIYRQKLKGGIRKVGKMTTVESTRSSLKDSAPSSDTNSLADFSRVPVHKESFTQSKDAKRPMTYGSEDPKERSVDSTILFSVSYDKKKCQNDSATSKLATSHANQSYNKQSCDIKELMPPKNIVEKSKSVDPDKTKSNESSKIVATSSKKRKNISKTSSSKIFLESLPQSSTSHSHGITKKTDKTSVKKLPRPKDDATFVSLPSPKNKLKLSNDGILQNPRSSVINVTVQDNHSTSKVQPAHTVDAKNNQPRKESSHQTSTANAKSVPQKVTSHQSSKLSYTDQTKSGPTKKHLGTTSTEIVPVRESASQSQSSKKGSHKNTVPTSKVSDRSKRKTSPAKNPMKEAVKIRRTETATAVKSSTDSDDDSEKLTGEEWIAKVNRFVQRHDEDARRKISRVSSNENSEKPGDVISKETYVLRTESKEKHARPPVTFSSAYLSSNDQLNNLVTPSQTEPLKSTSVDMPTRTTSKVVYKRKIFDKSRSSLENTQLTALTTDVPVNQAPVKSKAIVAETTVSPTADHKTVNIPKYTELLIAANTTTPESIASQVAVTNRIAETVVFQPALTSKDIEAILNKYLVVHAQTIASFAMNAVAETVNPTSSKSKSSKDVVGEDGATSFSDDSTSNQLARKAKEFLSQYAATSAQEIAAVFAKVAKNEVLSINDPGGAASKNVEETVNVCNTEASKHTKDYAKPGSAKSRISEVQIKPVFAASKVSDISKAGFTIPKVTANQGSAASKIIQDVSKTVFAPSTIITGDKPCLAAFKIPMVTKKDSETFKIKDVRKPVPSASETTKKVTKTGSASSKNSEVIAKPSSATSQITKVAKSGSSTVKITEVIAKTGFVASKFTEATKSGSSTSKFTKAVAKPSSAATKLTVVAKSGFVDFKVTKVVTKLGSSAFKISEDATTVPAESKLTGITSKTVSASRKTIEKEAVPVVPPPKYIEKESKPVTSTPNTTEKEAVPVIPPPKTIEKEAGPVIPPPKFIEKEAALVCPPPKFIEKVATPHVPPFKCIKKKAKLVTSTPDITEKEAAPVVPPFKFIEKKAEPVISTSDAIEKEAAPVVSTPKFIEKVATPHITLPKFTEKAATPHIPPPKTIEKVATPVVPSKFFDEVTKPVVRSSKIKEPAKLVLSRKINEDVKKLTEACKLHDIASKMASGSSKKIKKATRPIETTSKSTEEIAKSSSASLLTIEKVAKPIVSSPKTLEEITKPTFSSSPKITDEVAKPSFKTIDEVTKPVVSSPKIIEKVVKPSSAPRSPSAVPSGVLAVNASQAADSLLQDCQRRNQAVKQHSQQSRDVAASTKTVDNIAQNGSILKISTIRSVIASQELVSPSVKLNVDDVSSSAATANEADTDSEESIDGEVDCISLETDEEELPAKIRDVEEDCFEEDCQSTGRVVSDFRYEPDDVDRFLEVLTTTGSEVARFSDSGALLALPKGSMKLPSSDTHSEDIPMLKMLASSSVKSSGAVSEHRPGSKEVASDLALGMVDNADFDIQFVNDRVKETSRISVIDLTDCDEDIYSCDAEYSEPSSKVSVSVTIKSENSDGASVVCPGPSALSANTSEVAPEPDDLVADIEERVVGVENAGEHLAENIYDVAEDTDILICLSDTYDNAMLNIAAEPTSPCPHSEEEAEENAQEICEEDIDETDLEAHINFTFRRPHRSWSSPPEKFTRISPGTSYKKLPSASQETSGDRPSTEETVIKEENSDHVLANQNTPSLTLDAVPEKHEDVGDNADFFLSLLDQKETIKNCLESHESVDVVDSDVKILTPLSWAERCEESIVAIEQADLQLLHTYSDCVDLSLVFPRSGTKQKTTASNLRPVPCENNSADVDDPLKSSSWLTIDGVLSSNCTSRPLNLCTAANDDRRTRGDDNVTPEVPLLSEAVLASYFSLADIVISCSKGWHKIFHSDHFDGRYEKEVLMYREKIDSLKLKVAQKVQKFLTHLGHIRFHNLLFASLRTQLEGQRPVSIFIPYTVFYHFLDAMVLFIAAPRTPASRDELFMPGLISVYKECVALYNKSETKLVNMKQIAKQKLNESRQKRLVKIMKFKQLPSVAPLIAPERQQPSNHENVESNNPPETQPKAAQMSASAPEQSSPVTNTNAFVEIPAVVDTPAVVEASSVLHPALSQDKCDQPQPSAVKLPENMPPPPRMQMFECIGDRVIYAPRNVVTTVPSVKDVNRKVTDHQELHKQSDNQDVPRTNSSIKKLPLAHNSPPTLHQGSKPSIRPQPRHLYFGNQNDTREDSLSAANIESQRQIFESARDQDVFLQPPDHRSGVTIESESNEPDNQNTGLTHEPRPVLVTDSQTSVKKSALKTTSTPGNQHQFRLHPASQPVQPNSPVREDHHHPPKQHPVNCGPNQDTQSMVQPNQDTPNHQHSGHHTWASHYSTLTLQQQEVMRRLMHQSQEHQLIDSRIAQNFLKELAAIQQNREQHSAQEISRTQNQQHVMQQSLDFRSSQIIHDQYQVVRRPCAQQYHQQAATSTSPVVVQSQAHTVQLPVSVSKDQCTPKQIKNNICEPPTKLGQPGSKLENKKTKIKQTPSVQSNQQPIDLSMEHQLSVREHHRHRMPQQPHSRQSCIATIGRRQQPTDQLNERESLGIRTSTYVQTQRQTDEPASSQHKLTISNATEQRSEPVQSGQQLRNTAGLLTSTNMSSVEKSYLSNQESRKQSLQSNCQHQFSTLPHRINQTVDCNQLSSESSVQADRVVALPEMNPSDLQITQNTNPSQQREYHEGYQRERSIPQSKDRIGQPPSYDVSRQFKQTASENAVKPGARSNKRTYTKKQRASEPQSKRAKMSEQQSQHGAMDPECPWVQCNQNTNLPTPHHLIQENVFRLKVQQYLLANQGVHLMPPQSQPAVCMPRMPQNHTRGFSNAWFIPPQPQQQNYLRDVSVQSIPPQQHAIGEITERSLLNEQVQCSINPVESCTVPEGVLRGRISEEFVNSQPSCITSNGVLPDINMQPSDNAVRCWEQYDHNREYDGRINRKGQPNQAHRYDFATVSPENRVKPNWSNRDNSTLNFLTTEQQNDSEKNNSLSPFKKRPVSDDYVAESAIDRYRPDSLSVAKQTITQPKGPANLDEHDSTTPAKEKKEDGVELRSKSLESGNGQQSPTVAYHQSGKLCLTIHGDKSSTVISEVPKNADYSVGNGALAMIIKYPECSVCHNNTSFSCGACLQALYCGQECQVRLERR